MKFEKIVRMKVDELKRHCIITCEDELRNLKPYINIFWHGL